MLNRDLTDEHAAVVRYLIHSYQEGEDTVVGASLLSRCREEMWHMHWLGMIIGELGGEPDFTIGPYPFDSASRETMLQSYIQYEEKLIPHYNDEAQKVDDPHIRRVLRREAWESAIHALRFQRLIEKLSPEERDALPEGDRELPVSFAEKLQDELLKKYTEMLQHVRISWVFQNEERVGWQVMDQAMEKMKHLAIFAEALAEDGGELPFKAGSIDMSRAVGDALRKAVDDLQAGGERYRMLQKDEELLKHSGIALKMDLAVRQIDYQKEEIEDWIKK
jgi:bacterioferritin